MNKVIWKAAIVSLLITIGGIGIYDYFSADKKSVKIEHINSSPATQVAFQHDQDGKLVPLDFTKVAEEVMKPVVHIKNTQTFTNTGNNRMEDLFRGSPFEDFFGPGFQQPRSQQPQIRMGQGSGVIISEDGYIITNNHVIDNADDLEVTLHDNRTYKATVIGTDPSTDLALIQIKEKNLPVMPMVNSDDVKVGEWVLAVGNPFNLTSTVTAGIVSAKGRNINILREQYAVESFIQTDAAINPGNSGGALVNLNGGLIGINTAIASPTGAYSGYGFAVPTNIVQKVVEDLIEFGVVQRGVLGVMIRSVDGDLKREKELDVINGVYVDSVMQNSAAGAAGIQSGDVILALDSRPVNTSPELQEAIARKRPGDEVNVSVNRFGKEMQFKVILNNRQGDTAIVKKEDKSLLNILGANLEDLTDAELRKLEIPGGVRVKNLNAGKIRKQTNMKEGFIITKVDGKAVSNKEEFLKHLKHKSGGVMLEGVYPDLPGSFYYAFGL